jgi:hypothetical protein
MSAHLFGSTATNDRGNRYPRLTRNDSTSLPAGSRRPGQALELAKHQHLRLADAEGWTVSVLSGELWITQDGDVRDIVVGRGQDHVLDRNGLALLSALGDTRFLICHGQPCAQSSGRRQQAPSLTLRPSLA